MIDLQILQEHGLTEENLKLWFSEDPDEQKKVPKEQQDQIQAFKKRVSQRFQAGRDWNIKHHPLYHALDLAWDSPHRQISPTLLQSLAGLTSEDNPQNTDVGKKLASWGFDLSKVLEKVDDPKSTNKAQYRVNVPAFFNIFVPLVRAYVTIRWAKIVNDGRLFPFFKYEPALDIPDERMRCDVITSRVEVMARQIGYFEIYKQCVFQMLHYGICLQFPEEAWYQEEQLLRGKDGKATKRVVREGIRYHMPHPNKMFWDQAHRVSTFNTDTGCTYAGYWRITRYGDLLSNHALWNTERLPLSVTNWWDRAYTYLQTVHNCTLTFPVPPGSAESKNREDAMENRFYSGANNEDQAIVYGVYFERLVPKDHGLGTYPHPVWMRFICAGDVATIVNAEVTAYPPVIAWPYDADEMREVNASMSLECLPFQDQFSNLLTQYLLTVQHNLTNLTFIDTDQVNEGIIKELEGAGARQWVKRVFARFSSKKAIRAQQTTPNAAFSVALQQLPSDGILNAMKVVLDTLDRVLVMSQMEVAQTASHEQTREEVRNIAQNTSTRLSFTESAVYLAREAWKRQVYEGLMAYGDEEFYTTVPFENEVDKKALEKLGFTVEPEDKRSDEERYRDGKTRVKVKMDRTAVGIESFASNRDGDDRINNTESAIALATFLRDVVNGPYGAVIGPDQFISMTNEILRMAGAPRDFKLKNRLPAGEMPPTEQEQAAAAAAAGQPQQAQQQGAMPDPQAMMQQMAAQLVEVVTQQVNQGIAETIAPAIENLGAAVKTAIEASRQAAAMATESNDVNVAQADAIKIISSAISNLQASLGISPMPPSITDSYESNPATGQPAQPGVAPELAPAAPGPVPV